MSGALRAARAVAVMTLSVALMAVAGVTYLRGDSAAAPRTSGGGVESNRPCPPTELTMTGAFTECANLRTVDFCPLTFDQAKVLRVHSAAHDFLVYIEINGAYRGPGLYQLRPWPHPGLGSDDGVAKVAVREYESGQLWESAAGWVRVDESQREGSLSAGLVQDAVHRPGFGAPVKLDLNLDGGWSCS